MPKVDILSMSFSKVYGCLLQKVERKGRTKGEMDELIFWLLGYDEKTLSECLQRNEDCRTFYGEAPRLHPKAVRIKGSICGIRVEEIEDETLRRVRYLDKLVDELSKGKPMEKFCDNRKNTLSGENNGRARRAFPLDLFDENAYLCYTESSSESYGAFFG